jgi:hypothetical protein
MKRIPTVFAWTKLHYHRAQFYFINEQKCGGANPPPSHPPTLVHCGQNSCKLHKTTATIGYIWHYCGSIGYANSHIWCTSKQFSVSSGPYRRAHLFPDTTVMMRLSQSNCKLTLATQESMSAHVCVCVCVCVLRMKRLASQPSQLNCRTLNSTDSDACSVDSY